MSNFIAGFVVKNVGYDVGFLMLAGIAVAGLALFYLAMPETKASQPWQAEARSTALPEVVQ